MDIYREILSALESEESLMLATIISTSGSTPACALSKMLIKWGGTATSGTVGGGCMEGEVLLHANRLYNSRKAEIVSFHLNEDIVEHGLICGGSLDVLIEPITRDQIPLLDKLISFRDGGRDCIIATLIGDSGTVTEKIIIDPEETLSVNDFMARIRRPASETMPLIERAYRKQQTGHLKFAGLDLILEPALGLPELVIFGGGHVSRFVSRVASLAGFRITVVDDREKYANALRFPEAERTIVTDFSNAFTPIDVRPSTYLLIVTRGHEFDEQLLELALQTPAKYIGMIGSKRKVLRAFEHLIDKGIPAGQLRRVHAPVGIEIGAVTAEEIAVSIVAQLINIRRDGPASVHDKSNDMHGMLHQLDRPPVA